MAEPKILILDIEWRPALVYTWRPFKEFITEEKIVENDGLICVGCKWLGEKEVFVFSDWSDGHKEMLRKTRDLIERADAIVTFNGDRFDLPKLEGEFILHEISLPPKTASIDLYKTVKKLGYFKNSLKYVSSLLDLGAKMEHEGFMLWRRCMNGDQKAIARMEKYCGQDVRLTEKLYNRLLPAIRNHPNLGRLPEQCPTCGSDKSHRRGSRYTRYFEIRRLRCSNGHWYDGERSKL